MLAVHAATPPHADIIPPPRLCASCDTQVPVIEADIYFNARLTNQDVIYNSLLSLAFPAISVNSNGSALFTFAYSSNYYDDNGIPTNNGDFFYEYPGAPPGAALPRLRWGCLRACVPAGEAGLAGLLHVRALQRQGGSARPPCIAAGQQTSCHADGPYRRRARITWAANHPPTPAPPQA